MSRSQKRQDFFDACFWSRFPYGSHMEDLAGWKMSDVFCKEKNLRDRILGRIAGQYLRVVVEQRKKIEQL